MRWRRCVACSTTTALSAWPVSRSRARIRSKWRPTLMMATASAPASSARRSVVGQRRGQDLQDFVAGGQGAGDGGGRSGERGDAGDDADAGNARRGGSRDTWPSRRTAGRPRRDRRRRGRREMGEDRLGGGVVGGLRRAAIDAPSGWRPADRRGVRVDMWRGRCRGRSARAVAGRRDRRRPARRRGGGRPSGSAVPDRRGRRRRDGACRVLMASAPSHCGDRHARAEHAVAADGVEDRRCRCGRARRRCVPGGRRARLRRRW